MKLPKKILARQYEITAAFLAHLDAHLQDILAGRATEMLEIRDLADLLHIHPTHLSNTVKLTTGQSPCFFFEEKLLQIAQQLLRDNSRSVADIALSLTFDPSNFTKFFKRFTGVTPKQYRENYLTAPFLAKTEVITI